MVRKEQIFQRLPSYDNLYNNKWFLIIPCFRECCKGKEGREEDGGKLIKQDSEYIPTEREQFLKFSKNQFFFAYSSSAPIHR
jgi:hypothetical protein